MPHIFIVFLLISSSLQAKEVLKKDFLEKMIQPKINIQSSYFDDATLKDSPASVSLTKHKISLNNKIAGVSYTNSSFSWKNINSLPFGDTISSPIQQIHTYRVKLHLPYKINKKWFLLNSVSLKSSFEKESQNSYGFNVFSFASYKVDDIHTLQTGAFINYHPIKTLALPVLSYSYRARKNDGIQVIVGFPRTYIGYHMNKKILLRFGLIYSQSLVKLSKQSTITKNGYLETKNYVSNIGLVYDSLQKIKFNLDFLHSMKRDFTIYNENANEIQKNSVQSSFGINVKVSYIF